MHRNLAMIPRYYSQKKYGVKIKAFLRISESSEALV